MNANAESNPNWPVWAHDQRWAWKLKDSSPLCVVTQEYLSDGQLLKMALLDSSLRLFAIDSICVEGRAGLFGWRPGYKGKYFRVKPSFKLQRQLNLVQAKEYVLEFIGNHSSIYRSGDGAKDVIAAVRIAASPQELILAAQ